MPGGQAHAVLFSALLAGCGPAPLDLFLARRGEALILARVSPGGAPDLTGYELRPGLPAITREINAGEDELTALFYEHSLAALRLPSGPISLEPSAELLPPPDKILTIQDELEPLSWFELPELPVPLDAVRVARIMGCNTLGAHDYTLPNTPNNRVLAAQVIGPHQAYVLTDSGRGWLLDEGGARESSFAPARHEWVGSWYDAAGDEVWIFDDGGSVQRGHPDRGFVPGPALPIAPGDRLASIAGSEGTAPAEVFAVTASTAVYQWEGGTWRERVPPNPSPPDVFLFRRVSWLGPGHALVVGTARASALDLDPSGAHSIALEGLEGGLGNDRAQTLRTLPGWGPLIGTRSGRLLSQQGTRFAPFAQRLGGQIRVIEAIDDGILFGGDDGVLAEFRANLTDCEPRNFALTTDQPFDYLLPLEGAFIAISRIGKATDLPIIVLTR